MKDDPSPMMRKVHAMKQAAQEETRGLTTAKEYFEHIRKMIPDLGLPTARKVARGSRGRSAAAAPKAWRRTAVRKPTRSD
jgi:hypothetical protein